MGVLGVLGVLATIFGVCDGLEKRGPRLISWIREIAEPSFPANDVAVAFSENGTSRAILIGVDDYFGADERFDLKYAGADVELMRERLLGLGFHPENVVALTTANGKKAPEFEPKLANLEKTLAELLAKTRPEDSVFVFFSGHGFQTRQFMGLRNYVGFVASDSAWRTDGRLDVSTTFALSKFFNDLAKTKARFKWAVVDACRETLGPEDAKGGMKNATLGNDLGVLKARSGLLILQSCGDGQYSYEDDELKHSSFTYRLAESLGPKGDTNGDGAIKFWEAIARTTDKMEEVKPEQIPTLSCVETRDFILASSLPEPPSETANAAQTPEAVKTANPPVAPQTPQTAEATETPKSRRAFALLVGVDKYRDEKFSKLKCAVADVETMRAALIKIGFPPENIETLTDKAATRAGILSALEAATTATGPDDALFVMFSGHGDEEKRKSAFIVPYDYDANDDVGKIRVDELVKITRRDDAKFRTILLDACGGETFSEAPSSGDGGFAYFHACSRDELAWERSDKMGSVFTLLFVEGIENALRKGDEPTVASVWEYAAPRTSESVRAMQPNASQTPFLYFEGADFPLAGDAVDERR